MLHVNMTMRTCSCACILEALLSSLVHAQGLVSQAKRWREARVSCAVQLWCMHACNTIASQSCIAAKDAKKNTLTYSHRLCSSIHNSLMSGLGLLWDADPRQICGFIVIDFWRENTSSYLAARRKRCLHLHHSRLALTHWQLQLHVLGCHHATPHHH